jgi:hypothetical protein
MVLAIIALNFDLEFAKDGTEDTYLDGHLDYFSLQVPPLSLRFLPRTKEGSGDSGHVSGAKVYIWVIWCTYSILVFPDDQGGSVAGIVGCSLRWKSILVPFL